MACFHHHPPAGMVLYSSDHRVSPYVAPTRLHNEPQTTDQHLSQSKSQATSAGFYPLPIPPASASS